MALMDLPEGCLADNQVVDGHVRMNIAVRAGEAGLKASNQNPLKLVALVSKTKIALYSATGAYAVRANAAPFDFLDKKTNPKSCLQGRACQESVASMVRSRPRQASASPAAAHCQTRHVRREDCCQSCRT